MNIYNLNNDLKRIFKKVEHYKIVTFIFSFGVPSKLFVEHKNPSDDTTYAENSTRIQRSGWFF